MLPRNSSRYAYRLNDDIKKPLKRHKAVHCAGAALMGSAEVA